MGKLSNAWVGSALQKLAVPAQIDTYEEAAATAFLQDLLKDFDETGDDSVVCKKLRRFFKIRELVIKKVDTQTPVGQAFDVLNKNHFFSIREPNLNEQAAAAMLQEIFEGRQKSFSSAKPAAQPSINTDTELQSIENPFDIQPDTNPYMLCSDVKEEQGLVPLYNLTGKDPRKKYVEKLPLMFLAVALEDTALIRALAAQERVLLEEEHSWTGNPMSRDTPLRYAATNDLPTSITALVEACANPNAASVTSGRTALMCAVNREESQLRLSTVQALLNSTTINVHQEGRLKDTPWKVIRGMYQAEDFDNYQGNLSNIIACFMQHETFYDAKISDQLRYLKGNLPQTWAIQGSHEKVIVFLIQTKRFDLSVRYSSGVTILHAAASHGWSETVGALLADDQGIKLLETENDASFTPLLCASQKGHSAVVGKLLAAGASIKVSTKSYNVLTACKNAETLKLLLAAKGIEEVLNDPSCATLFFGTRYHAHSHGESVEQDRALCTVCIQDPHISLERAQKMYDSWGDRTSKEMINAWSKRLSDTVTLLKADQPDVQTVKAANIIAIERLDIEMVQCLIDTKLLDHTVQDKENSESILHRAARKQRPDMVAVLLKSDVVRTQLLNAVCDGVAPIHLAPRSVESMRLLVEAGADLTTVDSGGGTILHRLSQYVLHSTETFFIFLLTCDGIRAVFSIPNRAGKLPVECYVERNENGLVLAYVRSAVFELDKKYSGKTLEDLCLKKEWMDVVHSIDSMRQERNAQQENGQIQQLKGTVSELQARVDELSSNVMTLLEVVKQQAAIIAKLAPGENSSAVSQLMQLSKGSGNQIEGKSANDIIPAQARNNNN